MASAHSNNLKIHKKNQFKIKKINIFQKRWNPKHPLNIFVNGKMFQQKNTITIRSEKKSEKPIKSRKP